MERAFIKTPTTLSIVVNNKQYIIDKSHVNYEAVSLRLKEGNWAGIENLLDVSKVIERRAKGAFEVRDGAIFWNGEQLHNIVVDRIVQFTQAGENYKPLLAFLENLMENPSSSSVEELYKFLEHKNLPITEDGHFLAYKAVRGDFKDKWTGTIDNSIGAKPMVKRNQVDDNRNNGCSKGLHVGSLEYVKGYGNGYDDKILIVKVNPRDVVSVPLDCSCQKVRVCHYEVIALYDGPLPDVLPSGETDDGADDWTDEDYDDFEDEICDECGEILTDEDDGECPNCSEDADYFEDEDEDHDFDDDSESEDLERITWVTIK